MGKEGDSTEGTKVLLRLGTTQLGGHQTAGEAVRRRLRGVALATKLGDDRPQRVLSRMEPSQTCASKSWERWGQWPGGPTWGGQGPN